MPTWMKIENLRITTKISLIVLLFAAVSIGATGFSTVRMRGLDDAYSDLIARVDSSATLTARANRSVATYLSRAYQLVAETTPEGNARLLAEARESEKNYGTLMETVRTNVPEQAGAIDVVVSGARQAFAAC